MVVVDVVLVVVVAVADRNHSGHGHGHVYDPDPLRLSRDYGATRAMEHRRIVASQVKTPREAHGLGTVARSAVHEP